MNFHAGRDYDERLKRFAEAGLVSFPSNRDTSHADISHCACEASNFAKMLGFAGAQELFTTGLDEEQFNIMMHHLAFIIKNSFNVDYDISYSEGHLHITKSNVPICCFPYTPSAIRSAAFLFVNEQNAYEFYTLIKTKDYIPDE